MVKKKVKKKGSLTAAAKHYARAVKLYLAGDADQALEAVEATLLCDSTHREAKQLQKRLIEGDRAKAIVTKNGGVVYKDGDGHFLPGQSPNPAGRPVGSSNKISIKMLIEKMAEVEGQEGREELLVHFLKRAYKSDTVLLGLMKKLLPDLKVIEGLIATAATDMPEAESLAIQEILRQRYSTDEPSKTHTES